MIIKFTSFWGESPRTEPKSLPDNAAQETENCDFSSQPLRGIKDPSLVSVMPNISYVGSAPGGEPIVSVWTENGTSFFGWPWEVDVVKSPVIDDLQKRVIYTGMPSTGWIIKQARTKRDDGTIVIGNDNVLGNGTPGSGNYKPPEASRDLDSWDLGVLPPSVQLQSADDLPTVALVDRAVYPDCANLSMRVTYFIESPTGEILWQQDISNNEWATHPNTLVRYPGVFYTNNSDNRGNLIQDMNWPLGYTPRPLKYYWFTPPVTDTLVLTRTVTVTNTALASDPNPYIAIEYTGTIVASPDPGNPDGPPPLTGGGPA